MAQSSCICKVKGPRKRGGTLYIGRIHNQPLAWASQFVWANLSVDGTNALLATIEPAPKIHPVANASRSTGLAWGELRSGTALPWTCKAILAAD